MDAVIDVIDVIDLGDNLDVVLVEKALMLLLMLVFLDSHYQNEEFPVIEVHMLMFLTK